MKDKELINYFDISCKAAYFMIYIPFIDSLHYDDKFIYLN